MSMSYADDEIAGEVADDTPSWVKEGTEDDEIDVPGENISAATPMERTDVIDPAKGVELTIKSITMDKYTPDGSDDWYKITMKPMLVVGDKGVDGKGKYRNKHFFPRDIVVAVNRAAYPDAFGKPYWQPSGGGFGPYNTFLAALGIKTNPAPSNNAEFRKALIGRKLLVDITRDKEEAFDKATKKYVKTGEYVNNLKYTGAPKQAAAAPAAEAAVS